LADTATLFSDLANALSAAMCKIDEYTHARHRQKADGDYPNHADYLEHLLLRAPTRSNRERGGAI
jgi:hypothetical protein